MESSVTIAAPERAEPYFAIGYRDVFEATKLISGRPVLDRKSVV